MATHLLPKRHPDRDFFIADVLDAVPRDDMASMEHPVFSLATKPDMRTLVYEHRGNVLKIIPSGHGMATIFDKDILIYCTSQLVAAINTGAKPSRVIRLTAHDMLVATNRPTAGVIYQRLEEAFIRLRGTTIQTNIKTDDQEIIKGFGLIESYEIIRKQRFTGRMIAVEITLSEWLYNAILGFEVLPISQDYFRLRRPIERRMYELARKHCGKQESWKIGLPTLKLKLGTTADLKKLRLNVRQIVAADHLPDYHVSLDLDDNVLFRSRAQPRPLPSARPSLKPGTYEKARKAAPGWDVYMLESEWIGWWREKGGAPLKSPDAAFLGFCRRRYEREGSP